MHAFDKHSFAHTQTHAHTHTHTLTHTYADKDKREAGDSVGSGFKQYVKAISTAVYAILTQLVPKANLAITITTIAATRTTTTTTTIFV